MRIAGVAAASGTVRRPLRSAIFGRTLSASMMSTAMSMNGSRIVGTKTTRGPRQIAGHGQAEAIAANGFYAEVTGPPYASICAPRAVSGPPPEYGLNSSASASPGRSRETARRSMRWSSPRAAKRGLLLEVYAALDLTETDAVTCPDKAMLAWTLRCWSGR